MDPNTLQRLAEAEDAQNALPSMNQESQGEQGMDLPPEFSDVKRSRSAGSGMLLLVLVVILGAGGIYGMRISGAKISVGAAANQFEQKVDQALKRLSSPATAAVDPASRDNVKTLLRDSDAIMQVLDSDPTELQVPVSHVKQNPFVLLGESKPAATTAKSEDNGDKTRKAELDKLDREAAGLALQTVMRGRVPLAIINGEMYQAGQSVGSFEIARIDVDTLTVELANPLKKYVLSMEAKVDDKSGKSGRKR